jgi:Trypsin-co-occurring domain 1
MTGQVFPVRVGDVELLVEVTPLAGSEPTATRLDRAQEAVTDAFEHARQAIVAIAESTVSTIGRLTQRSVRPDELEVKFGLKFSAQGNVIVAGASGEATLEVTLTYRPDRGAASAGQA